MTGSFPVADHLRCLASASSAIITGTPFLVTAFWHRTRSDQRRDDAGQSDPVVLLVDRLRFAGGATATGLGRNLDGSGTMPDDPTQIVEDRCLGASNRAESLGALGQQLPLC